MKRREIFSEYDDAKRFHSRKELYNDRLNSDDNFSHKSFIGKEYEPQIAYSHNSTNESRSHVHEDCQRNKGRCSTSISDDMGNGNPSQSYNDLCIRYIPSRISNSDLEDGLLIEFQKYGRVSVKIINEGINRRAYIRFAHQSDAKIAFMSIEEHPLLLDDRRVEVVPCFKKSFESKSHVKTEDILSHTGQPFEIDSYSISTKHKERIPEFHHKLDDNFHTSVSKETMLNAHSIQYVKSYTPTTLLCVGHLDSQIQKDDLINVFHRFGSIVHVDMRRQTFGNSFAFVKFRRIGSSKKALGEMAGKRIGKLFCKIGYSRFPNKTESSTLKTTLNTETKTSVKSDKFSSLCISEIPKSISNRKLEKILMKTYERFSSRLIMSIRIQTGKQRIAFVDFNRASHAARAYKANIQLNIMNSLVKVMPFTEKAAIAPELDEKATRTLFIGNLPTGITENDIRFKFKEFGPIEYVTVKRPKSNKVFAFVKYINMDYAYKAKMEMNGKMFQNCKINIGYGTKSSVTSCLWVGGLGSWVDVETLRQEFRRFGEIRRIVWSKGSNFAYVQYEDNAAAEAACDKLHGWPMGGLDKRLRVDFVSVKQILTALEKSEKADSKDDPLEDVNDDEDENDQSEESETALSTSNISDNSFKKSCSSSRSPSPDLTNNTKSSDTSSVNSHISDQEAAQDEESGILRPASEDYLIIKTPFSPIDELSYMKDRTVFVQSTEKITDFDYHSHHKTHKGKPHGTRCSPSLQRVGESLQQAIKHYRRESGLPKQFSDLYKQVYDRHGCDNDVYERVPEFNRGNADQYRQSPRLKKYPDDEEYEKNENHEHQDSDLYRRDFLEQDRTSPSNEERSNALRKQNIFETRYQETFEEPSHQSSLGYSDKLTRNRHTEHSHSIKQSQEYERKNENQEHRDLNVYKRNFLHADQYRQTTVSKENVNKEYESEVDNREHQDPTLYRIDYTEGIRMSYSNQNKSDIYGTLSQEALHGSLSRELSQGDYDRLAGYRDTEHSYGDVNTSSRIQESYNYTRTSAESQQIDPPSAGLQSVLHFERSLQFANMGGHTPPVSHKTSVQYPTSSVENVGVVSSRSRDTISNHKNTGVVNSVNYGTGPALFHSTPIQTSPISYGDSVSATHQTPRTTSQLLYQQTLPDWRLPFQGNVPTILCNPMVDTANLPTMIRPVHPPTIEVGQFPKEDVQTTSRPVIPQSRLEIEPPPISFSRTNFSDIGGRSQANGAGAPTMTRGIQRAPEKTKTPYSIPWHIQQ